MESQHKQDFIRRRSEDNQEFPLSSIISWSRHSILELRLERFDRNEVEFGLQNCEVIENYPTTHRHLPDCLVMGRLESGEPFHAVVALDQAEDRLLIVTVYSPGEEEWKDDWRTRR